MIITEKEKSFVASSGVKNTKQFSIATTAKMFQLLSNSLYNDKYAAVIRELSTNAYDSHVMSKCEDKPFDVWLPTPSNNTFKIRDYGTGLTPEQMETLYTTYGESNKDGSNMFVGALGLGSKSPFCLVKSFVSTSYQNGWKYVYICALNEDNIPVINFMGKTSTSESDGLEVSFTTNSGDYRNFHTAATKVYQWFNVRPNFKSMCSPLVFQKYERTGDYVVLDGYNQNSLAVMGNIAYTIDASQFSDKYKALLQNNICLHFNIGEVEIDISREGLQYTKNTIKAIVDKINNIIKLIDDEMNKERNEFNKKKKYASLLRKYKLFDAFITQPPINTIVLPAIVDKSKAKYNFSYVRTFNRQPFTNASSINLDNNLVIIHQDDNCTGRQIKHYRNNFNGFVYVVKFLTADGKEQFLKDIGGDDGDLLLGSSLPQPPKQARTQVSKHTVFKFLTTSTYHYSTARHYNKRAWKEDKIDFDNGSGAYVEINNWKILNFNSKHVFPNAIAKLLLNLKDCGIYITENIYGIKTKDIGKVKSKGLVPLYTFIVNKITEYITKNNMNKVIEDINVYKNTFVKGCVKHLKMAGVLDASHPVNMFIEQYNKYEQTFEQSSDKLAKLLWVMEDINSQNILNKKSPATNILDDEYNKLCAKYPILSVFPCVSDVSKLKILFSYLK